MDTHPDVVETTTDITDDLLADLVLTPGAGESTDEEILEALSSDDIETIEVLNEKSEALENQESSLEAGSTEQAAAPAKAPKEKKERKAAAPKINRDVNAVPDEFFQLDVNGTADKAAVIALRPTQKKVAEKFDNLFSSIAAGRKPSVYTMTIFELVADKGEVTSADLVAAMRASSSRGGGAYDEGTARSQVGQMMNLFSVVGIAKRDGNKLTFNKDSKIAERLKAL